MEIRPKLQIELSDSDKLLELAGWLILIFIWAITLYNYPSLPEIIPTHFNGSGKIDDYGSKTTIFLLPLIGSIIFVGLTFLNKYPHTYNFPTKITPENALRQYTIATKMIRYLKFIILVIFSAIAYMTLQSAKGNLDGLSIWFVPITLVLIFAPLAFFIYKSIKSK
jgi:uncharacterized membrane protein